MSVGEAVLPLVEERTQQPPYEGRELTGDEAVTTAESTPAQGPRLVLEQTKRRDGREIQPGPAQWSGQRAPGRPGRLKKIRAH